MDSYFMYFSSCFCLILFLFLLLKFKKQSSKKFPPSPPSYPVIGHLHLLKAPIHRCLQDLSYTYGPIFSLKFASTPVLVVSSPQLLEECFSKHDIVFANRPQILIGKHLGYNNTAVAFSNYGPHWRNLRRVLTVDFLSTNRLNAYYTVRKEEKALLVKNLYDDLSLSYTKVEMRSRLSELTFNGVLRMATGKRFFGAGVEDLEEAKKLREIISGIFEMTKVGQANNFFKILQLIDFQGYEKKLTTLQEKSDAFLQSLVDQVRSQKKINGTKRQSNKTLIDEMLALQESEPEYYTDDIIKGNVATVIFAGTDTSSATIEWALSLLLNHPEILDKVKAEIETNIGHDHLVDELEVSKLPYIQCVVNEALRLFPISPMITPHMSSEDCVVGGFHIPRGTILLANTWALQRDPKVWDDPISFKPERFEGRQNIGYKFVPFGMGRRQCPGIGLANRVVSASLAALIQCFEWERVNEELVDLTELDQGTTMPKMNPLEAMCKPREQMINVLKSL